MISIRNDKTQSGALLSSCMSVLLTNYVCFYHVYIQRCPIEINYALCHKVCSCHKTKDKNIEVLKIGYFDKNIGNY